MGDRPRIKEQILAPTQTSRQHTIPKFYLDNFAVDGMVWTQDMSTGNLFQTSVVNASVVRGFYDLDLVQYRLSCEDWLSEVEGLAAPIIRKLAENVGALLSLDDGEETFLSRYLAAQLFRVPAFREWGGAMKNQVLESLKERAKAFLDAREDPEDAAEIWRAWEERPEWWWFQQEGPTQDAESTVAMLEGVQGWANIVNALPWKIGRTAGLPLYTCDNPVASEVPAIRPWWSFGGAIWEKRYFFPVSPDVLLVLGPMGYEGNIKPKGKRAVADFSEWHTSYARHVISHNATRFLFGDPPYVSKSCASQCLLRIRDTQFWDAIIMQGFRPGPPAYRLHDSVRKRIAAIDYSLQVRGKSRPSLTKFAPPPPPSEPLLSP